MAGRLDTLDTAVADQAVFNCQMLTLVVRIALDIRIDPGHRQEELLEDHLGTAQNLRQLQVWMLTILTDASSAGGCGGVGGVRSDDLHP